MTAASIRRRAVAAPALLLLLLLTACAAAYQPMGPAMVRPRQTPEALVAADGYRLPLRAWLPAAEPRAAIVALHGFNDYSRAFEGAGIVWAAQGIATYAYDQRGFGDTAAPGIWPGGSTLAADAAMAVRLVRSRHPGVPVYLLGESMGGAVAIEALTGPDPPAVDGAILAAPAVWGRETMNAFERVALWWAMTFTPGMTLTGKGLDITPSDNIEMLRALGRDPLVLKATRVDTIHGLVGLMDAAALAVPRLDVPLLVLLGEREEVLPPESVDLMLRRLPPTGRHTVASYPDGYHMLLRDLRGDIVLADIAAWVTDPGAPLPSGNDRRGRTR